MHSELSSKVLVITNKEIKGKCVEKNISPRQVLGVLNGGDHLVHGEKGRQVCSVRTEIEKLDDFDVTIGRTEKKKNLETVSQPL